MSNVPKILMSLVAVLFVPSATSLADDLLPSESLAAAELARYWQVSLPLAQGESLVAIHQADEHIYGVTNQAVVFVIDADTGLIRWAQQVARPGFKVFAPTHRVDPAGERQVVITTAEGVRFHELRYGDMRGEIELPFAPSTSAIADPERVYIGGVNGRYYAYRIVDGVRLWHVLTRGTISARPVLHGEELIIASRGGRIYVGGAEDKVERWTAHAGGAIYGDLAVSDELVYAVTQDRYLHAFHRRYGRQVWRRQLTAVLFDGPILVGDTLYQLGDQAGIVALEPARGEIRWTYEGTLRFLARGRSQVYLLDDTGQGVILNNTTGQPLAYFEASAAELTLTNTQDETLFLANKSGVVMCVRRKGAPALERGRLAAAASARPQPGITTRPTVAAGAPAEVPDPIEEILRDPLRSRSKVAPLTTPSARPTGDSQ